MKINRIIKYSIKSLLPSKIFLNLLIWRRGYSEPELRLLPYLCDKSKISVDIGASGGLYTAHMLKYSKSCYAFEPQLKKALYLEKLLSGLKIPLYVEPVALSNKTGKVNMKVFTNDLGRSTIEDKNQIEKLGNVEIISVPVKRLDDYEFEKTGCIKIDVEGHEESVLRGAKRILTQDHPSLIIEIEERHKPGTFKAVSSFLEELGYKGFFYYNNHLEMINSFKVNSHQNIENKIKGEIYINNFLFVTDKNLSKLQHLIKLK